MITIGVTRQQIISTDVEDLVFFPISKHHRSSSQGWCVIDRDHLKTGGSADGVSSIADAVTHFNGSVEVFFWREGPALGGIAAQLTLSGIDQVEGISLNAECIAFTVDRAN